MACLQIYRELLLLATFLRVHSNSKEVSYLFWQNTYHNLKTICHIKLKFFLWTKLLENLLLAKYLTSVAAPLTTKIRYLFCKKSLHHRCLTGFQIRLWIWQSVTAFQRHEKKHYMNVLNRMKVYDKHTTAISMASQLKVYNPVWHVILNPIGNWR